MEKIDAILVTYNPTPKKLRVVLASLKDQVRNIVIVDNSTDDKNTVKVFIEAFGCDKAFPIYLDRNLGVAKAQNLGITRSLENGADFVLLTDQDTRYPKDYVRDLLSAFNEQKGGRKIAAIGPDFAEKNRGYRRQGFFVASGVLMRRIHPLSGCHKVSSLISSGSIIPAKALVDIGLMRENLFVDWVDLDWCWRAGKLGYDVIGCSDIVIRHTLGSGAKKLFYGYASIHKPVRNYYVVRNAIFLSFYGTNLSRTVRIHLFLMALRYMILFSLFIYPRHLRVIYSVRGFLDGILQRMGDYH